MPCFSSPAWVALLLLGSAVVMAHLCLRAYLQDQGACESGELHLLSRREASVTHLLDRDDVIR